MSFDLETVRLTEERLVNVWPSVSTMLMDGWVVRFAHGYSGRANSASAVIPGARMPEALLDQIEKLYTDAGLTPSVRITPLADSAVKPLLMERGYRVKDTSRVMTLDLGLYASKTADAKVRVEGAPSRTWLAGVSARQEPSKRSADHLFAIVGHLRVPAAFATVIVEGKPVGFGMCAVDRGWAEIGSIMLDRDHRGKGLGRALVDSLLVWATQDGAANAFLQVDETNAPARSLYASQGFQELCSYQTIVRR